MTVSVAAFAALGVLAHGGWPGDTGVTALDFCEATRDGIVKQPANTWSNLGFVIVGLLIGFRAMHDLESGHPGAGSNRMLAGVFYPTFYAAASAFMGPGSFAMHASTTAWGGTLDVLSMYLWAGWILAYAFTRLLDWGRMPFLGSYVALTGVLGYFLLAHALPFATHTVFGIVITLALVAECLIIFLRHQVSSRRRWLGVAVGVFLLALAIWIPSRSDGPLCHPESLIQGHCFWHLLSAVSVGSMYLYYRSEQPVR